MDGYDVAAAAFELSVLLVILYALAQLAYRLSTIGM